MLGLEPGLLHHVNVCCKYELNILLGEVEKECKNNVTWNVKVCCVGIAVAVRGVLGATQTQKANILLSNILLHGSE